jgi:antitoxin VapB
MALNIKDAETDRLARELADLTGQPITVAVREAIAAQLEMLRRRRSASVGLELDDIIARGRARRTIDDRSEDEILGYGPDGLPS